MDRWQREYVRLVGNYMDETRPIINQLATLELYQPCSLIVGPGDAFEHTTLWSPEAAAIRDKLQECLDYLKRYYMDRIAKLARERLLPPDACRRSPRDILPPCSDRHGP